MDDLARFTDAELDAQDAYLTETGWSSTDPMKLKWINYRFARAYPMDRHVALGLQLWRDRGPAVPGVDGPCSRCGKRTRWSVRMDGWRCPTCE